ALSTSDTITVTLPTAATARAVSVHQFAGISALDKTATGISIDGGSTAATTAATATTASAEELLFAAFGEETKTGESFTPGASYTLLTRVHSDNQGPPTSHITMSPEYRR